MGKERCRPIVTGKIICSTPDLFAEGNLGKGPFQLFQPTDIASLELWLDDPNIATNIIESGSNVSQWTDISSNSNDFTQGTGANQPNRSGSEITFNGTTDSLDGTANIANFNQSSGEFFIIGNDLEGAGTGFGFLNFGDVSGTMNHMQFGMIGGDNTYAIVDRVGGVTNNIKFGAAVRSTTQIYSFSSSGTAYKLEVNGVDKAVSSGVDNGDWVADNPALDTLRLSMLERSSNIFFNTGLLSILYFNEQLSAADRLSVTNYLNDRFTIF